MTFNLIAVDFFREGKTQRQETPDLSFYPDI